MARHLVTSALPYVNSVKHLGNVVGSLLPADVHARWLRSEGHDVRFVCGTDEHGAPAEIAAERAGVPVRAFCDRLHAVQAEQYRALGLSFDVFGRTSGPGTAAVTREVYARLRDAGFVERRTVRQLWSAADGRFLADRFVEGTCPHCGHPDARGDQCDGCGRLLDPADLRDPRSALSGSRELTWRDSEHAFLRLSALADRARAHVDRHPEWNVLTRGIANAWLRDGLADRCISRDLQWGTAVPDLPGKVFWCWFDAPLGYAGILRDHDPDGWSSWWDPDADGTITQFLGKDNVPFHTVWFPAVLAGAGGLRLPDRVHGLHWLLWNGDKFSTTHGTGVFVDRALELLPADVWRWVLLARTPETTDTWFAWDDVVRLANKDLAGQLGNLVHRLLGLLAARGGRVPDGGPDGPDEDRLRTDVAAELDRLHAAHAALGFRDGIESLRGLFRLGNTYVDRRAPWRSVGTPEGDTVLRTCCALIRTLAIAVRPVLPFTSDRLATVLSLSPAEVSGSARAPGPSLVGRPITPVPPLFERLAPDRFS